MNRYKMSRIMEGMSYIKRTFQDFQTELQAFDRLVLCKIITTFVLLNIT